MSTELNLAYDNVQASIHQIQATVARITILSGDTPALPSATPADRANYEHRGYTDLHNQNRVHPNVDADPANAWLQAVRQ